MTRRRRTDLVFPDILGVRLVPERFLALQDLEQVHRL